MNLNQILNSKKPSDIFNIKNWEYEFKNIVKKVHPDLNKHPDAPKAFQILMEYKKILENGIEFSDEYCEKITIKNSIVTFYGDNTVLKNSYNNFKLLQSKCATYPHFLRYLPSNMELLDDKLLVYLQHESHRINDLQIDENHVKWFLNRLLEFSTLLNVKAGLTHCGINPNAVLICPVEHGIQIISFYHVVPINSNLKSVIGLHPYKTWYPNTMWTTKKSFSEIDLLMSKRTSATLLGDKNGTLTQLRGKISNDFLGYLLQYEENIEEAYFNYQSYLNKKPREFHTLNL